MLNSSGYFENPFFSEDELRCKGSGELNLAPGFLGMLIHLREVYNEPMVVNSCCRSTEHNDRVGGHIRSLHLTDNVHYGCATLAIDISTHGMDGSDIRDLIDLATAAGWSVGIAETFIHLDARILLGRSRADFTY